MTSRMNTTPRRVPVTRLNPFPVSQSGTMRAARPPTRRAALTLLIVMVLALTAFALLRAQPLQGQSTTVTLVKNTGKGISSFDPKKFDSEFKAWGQVFTTGSDVTEYRLDSIGIRFGTIHADSDPASELTVTLNDANEVGSAKIANDDVLCTLTNPATFTADAVNTFDAPTSGALCPFLKPETGYAVVVTRVNANTHEIRLPLASGIGEDVLTPPTGWTIYNNPSIFAGPDYPTESVIGTWITAVDYPMMIEVKGEVIPPQLTSAITAFTVQSEGWNVATVQVTVTSPGQVFIRWRPKSEANFGDNQFSEEPDEDSVAEITSHGFTRGIRYVVQASQDESFSDPAQLEFTHEWNTIVRDVKAIEVTPMTALLEVTVVPGDDVQRDVYVLFRHDLSDRWRGERIFVPANADSASTLFEDLTPSTTYVLDVWDNTHAHRGFFNRRPRSLAGKPLARFRATPSRRITG